MVKLLRGRGNNIEFDIKRGPLKLDTSSSQPIIILKAFCFLWYHSQMPIHEFLLKYSFNFVLVLYLVFEAFDFVNMEPKDSIIMYGHGHF